MCVLRILLWYFFLYVWMWVLLYRSVLQWKWAYCIIGFPDFVVMSTDTKRNLCNSKTNKQKAVGKLIVCLWCGLYFKPWKNSLGKPRLFQLQWMDFNPVTECGFEKQEVMWKDLPIFVSQKIGVWLYDSHLWFTRYLRNLPFQNKVLALLQEYQFCRKLKKAQKEWMITKTHLQVN